MLNMPAPVMNPFVPEAQPMMPGGGGGVGGLPPAMLQFLQHFINSPQRAMMMGQPQHTAMPMAPAPVMPQLSAPAPMANPAAGGMGMPQTPVAPPAPHGFGFGGGMGAPGGGRGLGGDRFGSGLGIRY